MIKNILWRMDGALFDTYPAITYAFSKSMSELGFPVPLNVIDGLVRKSIDQCVETLAERFKVDSDLLYLQFDGQYQQLAPANQAPFPGVKDVCAYIHSQGGLNVALVQCRVDTAQQLLATHNFDTLFAGVFDVEHDHDCKPISAMLETVLQEFGLDRDVSLVVSNQDIDIQAGSAAGLQTCLFGKAALSGPANFRIDSYDQLLSLLQEKAA